ncbi:hypothetical protein PPYR_08823 [Photinus pyralis]|uniref:Reverse transcriptase domain-containing protein n=1 Tax=Photinus pyralis TaxID=7054 RepID=A0A5N4AKG1_PHOPY|nr:hypothetical protein PPYR_08823 [Photinus pyralis]
MLVCKKRKLSSEFRNGLIRDPNKIDCIKRISIPTNMRELQQFLGAINFYGKYFHKKFKCLLDVLLKRNTTWWWISDQQLAFDKLKKILQSTKYSFCTSVCFGDYPDEMDDEIVGNYPEMVV